MFFIRMSVNKTSRGAGASVTVEDVCDQVRITLTKSYGGDYSDKEVDGDLTPDQARVLAQSLIDAAKIADMKVHK